MIEKCRNIVKIIPVKHIIYLYFVVIYLKC